MRLLVILMNLATLLILMNLAPLVKLLLQCGLVHTFWKHVLIELWTSLGIFLNPQQSMASITSPQQGNASK